MGTCKFTRDVKCHDTGACKSTREVKCHDMGACKFTRDVKCHDTYHLHGDVWSWARGHVRTYKEIHKNHCTSYTTMQLHRLFIELRILIALIIRLTRVRIWLSAILGVKQGAASQHLFS